MQKPKNVATVRKTQIFGGGVTPQGDNKIFLNLTSKMEVKLWEI